MRRLIAVLCVVAMMLMAVPALANSSVSSTVTIEGATLTPVDPEKIVDGKVKEIAKAVNGEGSIQPLDAVAGLVPGELDKDVEGYSFTSQFYNITATAFPATITVSGADAKTKIMLIDPTTGKQVIIKAEADGSFKIPFAGIIATLDPTP